MTSSAQGLGVVCLGEALIDRLGPPGGDPALDLPVRDRLGGAPANVACGLARLGAPVAFAGRLGQDAIGAAFSRLFVERGVGTALLQRDAERPVASCWSVGRWTVNGSFRVLTEIRGPALPTRRWSRLRCLRPDGC